jgi:hypothetical protein
VHGVDRAKDQGIEAARRVEDARRDADEGEGLENLSGSDEPVWGSSSEGLASARFAQLARDPLAVGVGQPHPEGVVSGSATTSSTSAEVSK